MHFNPLFAVAISLLSTYAFAADTTCFTRYKTTEGTTPIQTTQRTTYTTDCVATKTITKNKMPAGSVSY